MRGQEIFKNPEPVGPLGVFPIKILVMIKILFGIGELRNVLLDMTR